MREIKFRGWDGSRMHENVAVIHGKAYKDGYFGNIFNPNAKAGTPVQYTGLQDKNGVEIYKGDILKITSEYLDEPIISEVYWGDEEYPAFELTNYDGDTMNGFSAIYFNGDDEIEVIGNVYENSELLQEV